MMAPQEKSQQRHERNNSEDFILVMKHAPRRTGVAPIDEFEEAIDHQLLFSLRKNFQHHLFGGLVERKNSQRQQTHSSIGSHNYRFLYTTRVPTIKSCMARLSARKRMKK